MYIAQVMEYESLHIGAETEQVQLMALTAILPVRVKLLSTAERSVHIAQYLLCHMCKLLSQTKASRQLLAQQQQATCP